MQARLFEITAASPSQSSSLFRTLANALVENRTQKRHPAFSGLVAYAGELILSFVQASAV